MMNVRGFRSRARHLVRDRRRTRNRGRALPTLIAAMVLASSTIGLAASSHADPPPGVVWQDPASMSSQALYTRGVVLKHNGVHNGAALLTFEHDIFSNPASFPIYRSDDEGSTWDHVTDVQDVVSGRGLRQQPALYELPRNSGDLVAGTILLAGNAQPLDRSSTNLVLYKSVDQGETWEFLSTIDTGGPADYDPSPGSTTTPVWEPEIYLAGNDQLVVSYSDERQKANGVLQAIVHRRSSDGGKTWGPLVTDIAIPDQSTRPGMMSVTELPDGRYFGVYEVVGYHDVPVYGRFSDDGLDWGDPANIGELIATPNGSFLFGSPQVTWTPAGGANGTIVVNGGRFVAPSGHSKSMFLTSTTLGAGPWTSVPQPVQATGDIDAAAQYSQSTASTLDEGRLIQFTSILNNVGWHDVVSGVMPLNSARYAAADATRTNAQLVERFASVAGYSVGYINDPSSTVTFDVEVPSSGTYNLRVRYSNGAEVPSAQAVSVNGGPASIVNYDTTYDWNGFQFRVVQVGLNAGSNTVQFRHHANFAELDQIEVYQ